MRSAGRRPSGDLLGHREARQQRHGHLCRGFGRPVQDTRDLGGAHEHHVRLDGGDERHAQAQGPLRHPVCCWNWTADAFSVQEREDVREIAAWAHDAVDDGTLKPTISCLGIEHHGVYFPLYALDGSVERASAVNEMAPSTATQSTATFSDTVYFGLGTTPLSQPGAVDPAVGLGSWVA